MFYTRDYCQSVSKENSMKHNLKYNRSRFFVGWLSITVILAIFFTFSSCEKDCDCPDPEDDYPSLKVTNDLKDDWRSITTVSLIGYKFDKLNIESFGDSQTFILDKGMSGGYENINVTISYIRYSGIGASESIKVNFNKGETTSIILTGCSGAEGCPGISLK